MAIELVTGTPGAGKTLLTVWERLRPLQGTTIKQKAADGSDVEVPVRLMVGGIPDLLIDHEPITVPYIRWDNSAGNGYDDQWTGIVREPGQPPLDVEHRVDNWWLWCRPGDVIVVDEAWQCFGSFPAGRKIPDFYTMLARHRHYGVTFILIGQAPSQFHVFVRGLVDQHQFVRRMWRSSRLVVYTHDAVFSHASLKDKAKRFAKHDKRAFSLYKSSQLHVKSKLSIPTFAWFFLVAVLVVPVLWWRVISQRVVHPGAGQPAPAVSAPSGPAGPAGPAAPVAVSPVFASAVHARPAWPEIVGGCWVDADGCACVTQEASPRIVRDRPALCAAVVGGDLVPPSSHPRPVRLEPDPDAVRAAGPSPSASAPA